jgi:hypothetical protein
MSNQSSVGIAVLRLAQRSGHLTAQVADEHSRIQWLAEFAVVLTASLFEVHR